MPWFEVTIRHGPGHQSKSIKYLHQKSLTLKDVKELYSDSHNDYEYGVPSFKIKKLAGLPTSILKRMRLEAEREILFAKEKLKVIANTKVIPDHRHQGNWGFSGEKREVLINKIKFNPVRDAGWEERTDLMAKRIKTENIPVKIDLRTTMRPCHRYDEMNIDAARKAGMKSVIAYISEPCYS